jgi:uncharacterized membrane-anchored protein
MKYSAKWLAVICGVCFAAWPVAAQDQDKSNPLSGIKKLKGPATARMGAIAELKIPAGYSFVDAEGTKKLMEMGGDPVSGREMGLVLPTNGLWSVMFRYADTGYVKDDDKDKLDPDVILKAIKEGNDQANEYRKKRGGATVNVIGWEMPPKYNAETHNLEWAIRGESEGQMILNYNTRLLGRKGTMEVVLIVEPDRLAATLPGYQALLTDYSFQQGQQYAEYRTGDKVAKYGLAALITGGAAVVAVKTGLFAWLILFLKKGWKLVVLGVAAVGAFLKKLITGDRSRKQS